MSNWVPNHVAPKLAGLEDIKLVKSMKYSDDVPQAKKKIVGAFGIVQGTFKNKIYWVVSNRKDRRHGVVNRPALKDPYMEDLFETMFRKW